VSEVEIQVAALAAAIEGHKAAFGLTAAEGLTEALGEVAMWISHFRASASSRVGRELLDGAQAAAYETVSYAYLGLGRAAIAAMRQQIELLLGYSYFKDHPIEWDRVRRTGDGFIMFSAVEAYYKDLDGGLASRLAAIESRASPTLKQMYRILSAHVHGQSPFTVPKSADLSSIVLHQELVGSLIDLQRATSNALSCYLVAVHARQWPDLPVEIVRRVSELLTARQRPSFFAGG